MAQSKQKEKKKAFAFQEIHYSAAAKSFPVSHLPEAAP